MLIPGLVYEHFLVDLRFIRLAIDKQMSQAWPAYCLRRDEGLRHLPVEQPGSFQTQHKEWVAEMVTVKALDWQQTQGLSLPHPGPPTVSSCRKKAHRSQGVTQGSGFVAGGIR